MRPAIMFVLGALALAPAGCEKTPKAGGSRESGQSNLMGQTFAGQNACNPANHLRPFIIEWDATDMSSFESIVANDIVVVRYEGCNLVVLDECRNESIRGEQGSYRPPEWTSGSLEAIDISNEGELYAKLPLGSATLGGRVSGGEKFHMEYFVAGTRNATRDSVYRDDIASNPGCEGATHFVHGYNLGAFALGSANHLDTAVGGSVYGFGMGGSTSHNKSAEKKGGDLALCKSDSATEVAGCKAPIRLSLRPIRDGESPDKTAQKAPDTPDSLNAAGQISQKLEMSDAARAHWEQAQEKFQSRDGKGCLAELDMHGKLDPKHQSTDAKSPLAITRGMCLMLAGKCDAGKQLYRKAYAHMVEKQYGPEMVDKGVDAAVMMYCQGKMNERDSIIAALNNLQQGAYVTKKDAKFCADNWATIKKHKGKVKPRDEDDTQIVNLDTNLYGMVPACFAKAGDCKQAWSAYVDLTLKMNPEPYKDMKPAQRDEILRNSFEAIVSKCKGK